MAEVDFEDDIDAETLQAQVDMSMAFTQNLISSWMKSSTAQLPSSSSRRDEERELEEHMRRPPRLGVGATPPESSTTFSRDTARLKNKLTGRSGKKRQREEERDIAAGPSDDEDESRATAIKKKPKIDPFARPTKTKKVHSADIDVAKAQDTAEGDAKLKHDTNGRAAESSSTPTQHREEHHQSEHASAPPSPSSPKKKKKKKKKKRKYDEDASVTMPSDSPPAEKAVEPATPRKPTAEISSDTKTSSFFQPAKTSTPPPSTSPLSPKKTSEQTAQYPPAPSTPQSKRNDTLAVPLLNLHGPPSQEVGDPSSSSPKKKRKRKNKKKKVVKEPLVEPDVPEESD
ncbi:uncharacterized protein LAESUDRAFT_754054 [Laetiporus sulphureus 93-53]|uniref:Uncharacterized protein n=1 Tax=Laetiporus sulphureus 93-53 TaxID=1314785 RepID=A0A165IG67_9APHY|nr:uncharacterized protein LAESUDRAFT_754054 [Laetiporus sulphureus 93-53]KZT13028.1 hypothetical protein LAESUDRAFT_754054 [Laetiporus sulphureus 93-53]